MTQTTLCPCCKQPLPSARHGGVYLPPTKARVFDAISNSPGISRTALAQRIGLKVSTTKVHVSQINDLLAATDLRIRGGPWGYVVVQELADVTR
jgi:DNA-binding NarL/FixJ family response regulator